MIDSQLRKPKINLKFLTNNPNQDLTQSDTERIQFEIFTLWISQFEPERLKDHVLTLQSILSIAIFSN